VLHQWLQWLHARLSAVSAEKWTTILTGFLAFGTLLLALASCMQIGVMEDDQRPWLGLVSVGPRPGEGNPNTGLYLGANFINVGHSPAFVSKMRIMPWETDPKSVSFPISSCETDCVQKNIVMIPNAAVNLSIPIAGQEKLPKVGDQANIIFRIDYSDERGHSHTTAGCYVVDLHPVQPFPNILAAAATTVGCSQDRSNYAD
jgi:hypothetical protein